MESKTPGNRPHRSAIFDKLTEGARHAMVLAQEEARAFGHDYIGTEHLLLGLLRDEQTMAGRVLNELGVTIESGRKALAFINPAEGAPISPTRDIGLTPRAKKALGFAAEAARELDDRFLATEHILLGIIREGEGLGAAILVNMGVELDSVRTRVLRVRETNGATTEGPATRNNVVSFRLDDRALAAVDALVEAGVRTTRSEAASWLVEAGISAKQEFYQQVNATVAQIRALRTQVQLLARQDASDASPNASPTEDDAPSRE